MIFKNVLNKTVKDWLWQISRQFETTATASSRPPNNEPILKYLKNSPERIELRDELQKMSMNSCEKIPIVIGDKEYFEGELRTQRMPHNHQCSIASYCLADEKLLKQAIDTACDGQEKWNRMPIYEKIKIWERAAQLMAGEYRQKLNAATMLGQSKTVIQAEIDSAAELVDFWRFNCYYLKEAAKWHPLSPDPEVVQNSWQLRGIDGFFAAISPFNFTAIGGNLAYTPALMGNTVLWKPSDTAILSNWLIFKIMREAGLPSGIVNFVPSDGPTFGNTVTASPQLAGINFTGSVPTFQHLWRQVGENIQIYRNYPRLVGECGGKNYHFVHKSADPKAVAIASILSAFEYSGQKCSACSRMYVPETLWPDICHELVHQHGLLEVGDVMDFSVFTSAVIDAKSFDRCKSYIEYASNSKTARILAGGGVDNSVGYFIEPTIVVCTDPLDRLMTEEIFGPILNIYVYQDCDLDRVMTLIGQSTKYALTGSIFAKCPKFLDVAKEKLKMTAGNLYINDKSTGAVVGQQPFGGGRQSGTNDKAGAPGYILRFSSPQAIKQTFFSPQNVKYDYMKDGSK